MKNYPLVCICIPIYNNEKTISKTLDSLLNQTYKNIIIKIFDNASTDNTINILKKYEQKYKNIKVFQNRVNIGGEANFTKCIENGEGNYTAIFHADDLYYSKMIEKQVDALKKNDIVAIFTNAFQVNEISDIINKNFFPYEFKKKEKVIFDFNLLFKFVLKYGNFLTSPSCMVKTDIYKHQIKFFDYQKFKTSADLDVWLKLAKIGNIGFITEPLMGYRVSKYSFSYRNSKKRMSRRDFFLVMEYYFNKEKNKEYFVNYLKYYHYQIFKDEVNIAINSIINDKYFKNKRINVFDKNVLMSAFSSRFHIKYFIYGLIIKWIIFLGVPLIFKRVIYKIKFKDNL